MKRRNFLETSSLLAGGTLLSFSNCNMKESPKYKMGYQLYSIRDEMAKDPIATLKALKNMGYEDFETYGYETEKDQFYGYNSSDFKSILDDLGLSCSSGHFGFSPFLLQSKDALDKFVDACIIGAKALNMSYITWPWLAPELRTMDNYKIMAEKLNIIGEQVNAAGLAFAYHNHGFEFEDHNGENGFDIILNDTDADLVKLQIDMYWVMHSSSFTPMDLINKQPKRFVMWHIKDMDKVSRDYTELGNGSIDYLTLLPDPEVSGLEYYFLEQGGNFAHSSVQSAADSAKYFKEHLQQFL